MPRPRRTRTKVVKTNVRRVVKWKRRHNYAPYIILFLLLLIGILAVIFQDYLR
ncbi:hypothetical protein H5P28_07395 [Ruficoccus amylovorans]|uniref:Uncharacterized protein n=1 Tax=Ruficoccus amylovorans TaxID=1804625 RepID=A0A842HC79_9BACT|nr:hypothetical protein [Ruficoccus amylovorans]MBC2594085.1 hypothetical protein [Ruficoccus amylovorans]